MPQTCVYGRGNQQSSEPHEGMHCFEDSSSHVLGLSSLSGPFLSSYFFILRGPPLCLSGSGCNLPTGLLSYSPKRQGDKARRQHKVTLSVAQGEHNTEGLHLLSKVPALLLPHDSPLPRAVGLGGMSSPHHLHSPGCCVGQGDCSDHCRFCWRVVPEAAGAGSCSEVLSA